MRVLRRGPSAMNRRLTGVMREAASYLAAVVMFVLAFAQATPARAQTTALFMDSQPGDWVGAGKQWSYTSADATFQIIQNSWDTAVSVSVHSANTFWSAEFMAANGAKLAAGTYGMATRYPFTHFNAFDISGDGRGCNEETGRFVVREIVYASNGTVSKLAIDFEQHCDEGNPGLFGAIRYDSTVSSLVPFDGQYPLYRLHTDLPAHGSVTGSTIQCGSLGSSCGVTLATPATVMLSATADPGYFFAGWTGACHGGRTISVKVHMQKDCGALFRPIQSAQPTRLFLANSQPGDWILRGGRELDNAANSVWQVSSLSNGNGLRINIDGIGDTGELSWTMFINAPYGARLAPGVYAAADRFGSATTAGLDVSADFRGCNTTRGSFIVHELTIVSGVVLKLAIDFEQHCEGVTIPPQPLRGSIRFNSAVDPQPTLAITTTGSGAKLSLSPPESVCVGRCMETYAEGTIVRLTAQPSPGWSLASWSGDPDCADGVVSVDAPIACQAAFLPAAISADSVTPASGSGTTQTFTFQFSHTGATDIATPWIWFAESLTGSPAHSCMLRYERATNTLYLLADSASAWQPGLLGAAGTLQNSQCAIDLSVSSTTVTAGTLALTLPITFKPDFAGIKNVYLFAAGTGGTATGWLDRGDWTVPATPPPTVTADSVTPATGTGSTQTFAIQFSDTAGGADIGTAWAWFNASQASAASSCLVFYDRAVVYLLNDAGTAWQSNPPGSSSVLQNSQCAVSLAGSSATTSGASLTLTLAMTFKPAFAGAKNVYAYATGGRGAATGWQDRGDWIVPAPAAPMITADAVTPASGTGAARTFAAQYTHSIAVADIRTTWIWFSPSLSSSSAYSCMLYYDRSLARLNLLNDDGSAWTSGALGVASTLGNSQCNVSLATSTSGASGNTFTLTLAMAFAPTFAGSKNVYLFAAASGGINSGWQDRGDWEVPSTGALVTADAVTPNAGSGTAQTFAAQFGDHLGANDLRTTWVWFAASATATAAQSCLIFYDRAAGSISVLNDAGTAWQTAALGQPLTLQNGQCALDAGASSVDLSGNTLTLHAAMTFRGAYAGTTQGIHLFAAGNGGTSGWQQRGTYTIP